MTIKTVTLFEHDRLNLAIILNDKLVSLPRLLYATQPLRLSLVDVGGQRRRCAPWIRLESDRSV